MLEKVRSSTLRPLTISNMGREASQETQAKINNSKCLANYSTATIEGGIGQSRRASRISSKKKSLLLYVVSYNHSWYSTTVIAIIDSQLDSSINFTNKNVVFLNKNQGCSTHTNVGLYSQVFLRNMCVKLPYNIFGGLHF